MPNPCRAGWIFTYGGASPGKFPEYSLNPAFGDCESRFTEPHPAVPLTRKVIPMGKTARHLRPLAALLGAALALSTTACGANDASTATEVVDLSGSISGQSINYWSMWKEGEPQQKVIATAISDYEKETGAKVNVQWQGRSNTEKLVPALNTNNVPDLVDGTYAKLAPVIGDTGQASPLTAVYSSTVDGKAVNSLIPEKFTSNGAFKGEDGQPWMVPYSISSDGIWFDAAKHPELKAKPPATWDEFMVRHGAAPAQGSWQLQGPCGGQIRRWLGRSRGPRCCEEG